MGHRMVPHTLTGTKLESKQKKNAKEQQVLSFFFNSNMVTGADEFTVKKLFHISQTGKTGKCIYGKTKR